MKPTILAAIMFAVAACFAPCSGSQNQPAKAEQETKHEAQTDPHQPASPRAERGRTAQTLASENKPPHWYESPEWILVIVGSITAVVIAWQSIETRRAAQAARDGVKEAERAADAALLNAKAVINAERAWLLLDTQRTEKPVLVPIDAPGGYIQPTLAHCMVFLKNFGNTPATIVVSKFELQIGPSSQNPPSASLYDIPGRTINTNPYPIAPGEPWPVQATLTPDGFINSAQMADIKNGAKFLWLCGIVRYLDVFEIGAPREERETMLCFFYETRTNSPEPYWVLGGSALLNKAT